MGDLQAWPQPNGIVTEEKECSSAPNPHPSSIDGNTWAKVEERTAEIILCVQPTVKSEQKRSEVIDYVQRLLRRRIGCEVFPFGSVPLKTYLPDGDVDLTTFNKFLTVKDKWANDVRAVLEGEEYNKAAEYRVREVQSINAEVKLVKCLIENIVVDISFNQLGGLCTLCFLEKVDRFIEKDHLFKRSILLVKAWCYYESRLLGAHHALISTYALETLVLYIFNLFHASLHGPLEVLYRFLDYFSKFDWKKYCVSLQGPVSISALPDIVVEPPDTDGVELLLNDEFLKSCIDLCSVPPKDHDIQSRSLTAKYLNIIDPLRENNNLGRSVSEGNFFRIRTAFAYGARKLGKVLLASEEKISEELDKFFQNTLQRHGKGQRPDVPESIGCSVQSRTVGESTSFLQSWKSDIEDKKHDHNVFPQQIKAAERGGHLTESFESAGSVPDVAYSPRPFAGNKTVQGIKSSCPRANYELPTEENPVNGSRFAVNAKDLANNHPDHSFFRSKSPGVLPEHGINVKNKSVTGSVSEDSKSYTSYCQGHLSSKDTRNWITHEAANSSDMYCSCEHDDCQSATYIEQLSINDMGNSEQGKGSEEIMKGSSKADQDNYVFVNGQNFLSDVQRDDLTTDHISYSEQKDGVYECPEYLRTFSATNANLNTNIPSQGNSSPSHISGCNGPVNTGYSHPMQVDDRMTSLEEPQFLSGQHTQSSISSNLSDISRASDSTTSKSVDGSFYADKSLDGTQPSSHLGDLFNKPEESTNDWQSRRVQFSGAGRKVEMQREAVLDALRCLKSDLTADFDNHLNNLNFGKLCQEPSILPYPMVSPYIQEQYVSDGLVRSFHTNANIMPYMGYRVAPVPPFLHASSYRVPNSVVMPRNFNIEELPKTRSGTGTYFPNMSYNAQVQRYRGRNQGAHAQEFPSRTSTQMHRSRSNGRNKTTFDQSFQRQTGNKSIDVSSVGVRYGDREGDISNLWKSSCQSASNTVFDPMPGSVSHEVYSLSNMTGHGSVSISPKAKPSSPSVSMVRPHSNGSDLSSEQLEFGSFGPVQMSTISPTMKSEDSRHMDLDQLNGQMLKSGQDYSHASSGRIPQKPGALSNHEREASWSSLLKDDDFPPLSFERQHRRSSANAVSNDNSNNRGSHWPAFVTTS